MDIKIPAVSEEDFIVFVNKVNEIAEVLNAVNVGAARRMAATEEEVNQLKYKNQILEDRVRFLELGQSKHFTGGLG